MYQPGTLLSEQFAQFGTVAMRFVFAVAADGEIGAMGERGEEFDGVGVLRRGHFGAVLFDEFVPLGRSLGRKAQFHRRKTRGEVGEPDVVPVLQREFRFGHAPWRAAYGADPQTFVFRSRGAKSDDADSHDLRVGTNTQFRWSAQRCNCEPQPLMKAAATKSSLETDYCI
jgi:hypothetical protein